MKLKYDIPSKVQGQIDGEVIYALPFDLSSEGEIIEGLLVVTRNQIMAFNGDNLIKQYEMEQTDKYKAEQLVGSGMFTLELLGEEQIVCAFTQKMFIRYAEIAKLLEYQKKVGQFASYEEEKDEYICSKCGRPFIAGSTKCFMCEKKTKILGRMLKMCKPYKWLLIASIITTIMIESLWIINPYIMRRVIDDYIVPHNRDLPGLAVLLLTYVSVFVTITVLEHITMKASNKLSNGVAKDLRGLIFSKIQALSLSSISRRTTGELMNRLGGDAEKVQNFIADYGKEAIMRIFSFVTLSIILVVTNYKLAILVLVPVPIVAILIAHIDNILGLKYWKLWRKHSAASSILHDILSGIRVVKSFGNEDKEIQKYTDASEKLEKSMVSAETFWAKFFPFIGYLITIGEILILWYGGELVLGRQMEIGELIQYSTYVGMIYVPLRWAINLPKNIADISVSAAKVFEVIDESDELIGTDQGEDIKIHGDVAFENVSFGYKVYKPVLKDISFHINQGEMIGIVGASGVGKSTLINLLLHLYDVTEGSIKIDGIDIRDISQYALRSQMGVVLQETFLFDGNIIDNITYSKPDATFEEIIRAAKIANAHEFIVKLPDAYNTKVGEKGYTLSGGERQRIAIARAILHNPKILILDEATASLDTETEKQIQDALNRLIKGKTTFAIAHRLSTLRNADRLIVLDQGGVAEIGTHEELLANKSVYYNLVMAQRQTSKMKK